MSESTPTPDAAEPTSSPEPETLPASPPADLAVCPECKGTGEVSFQSTPFATGIKACPTCRPGQ